MLEYVASINKYTLFHDSIVGNYRIKFEDRFISYPSTKEEAYRRLRSFSNVIYYSDMNRCYNECECNCNDCDKYSEV